MNRGPAQKTFQSLPEKFKTMIFSYLPATQFVGSHNIASVCKAWHAAINSGELRDKKTFASLLKTCSQHPESIRSLLNHNTIIQQLSFEQYLQICGCDIELAKEILALNYNFTGADLVALSRSHLAIAQQILSTPHLRTKLSKEDLLKLGLYHLQVALDLVTNAPAGFNIHDQVTLGLTHVEVIEKVLAMQPSWLSKLDTYSLWRLAEKHHQVASLVLTSEEFTTKLYGNTPLKAAIRLGGFHPNVAKVLLFEPQLLENATPDELLTLARVHPYIAEELLRIPELNKDSYFDLRAQISACHLSTARTFYEKEFLTRQDLFKCHHFFATLRTVAETNAEIALFLLKNNLTAEYFRATYGTPTLVILGQKHLAVAKQLYFSTVQEDSDSLRKWDNVFMLRSQGLSYRDLALLGEAHEEIALAILKNQPLAHALYADNKQNLLKLGRAHHLLRSLVKIYFTGEEPIYPEPSAKSDFNAYHHYTQGQQALIAVINKHLDITTKQTELADPVTEHQQRTIRSLAL